MGSTSRRTTCASSATGRRRRRRWTITARCSTGRSSCARRRPALGPLPVGRHHFGRHRVPPGGHRPSRSQGRSRPRSPDPRSTRRGRSRDRARAGLAEQRIVVPTRIADDFAEIVETLDEPFADPSSFPTWYLARETERHVKVVLGGDGGDELFAGYKRIAKHLRNRWRDGPARCRCPMLPDVRPKGLRRRCPSSRWTGSAPRCVLGLTPNQRIFLQPMRKAWSVHYWRIAGLRRRRSSRPPAALGLCELPARVRAAQGRPHDDGAASSCAHRCSTTASSARCSPCRRRRRFTWPQAFPGRSSRRSFSASAPSPARSAASIRRSAAGLRGDLAPRLAACADSLSAL